jgi:hypothetical protein
VTNASKCVIFGDLPHIIILFQFELITDIWGKIVEISTNAEVA